MGKGGGNFGSQGSAVCGLGVKLLEDCRKQQAFIVPAGGT